MKCYNCNKTGDEIEEKRQDYNGICRKFLKGNKFISVGKRVLCIDCNKNKCEDCTVLLGNRKCLNTSCKRKHGDYEGNKCLNCIKNYKG